MRINIENIQKLPTTNGVYIFWDANKPIYIGKSVNIKARIKSHIENAKVDAKEAAIIESSIQIEYIITDSEFKALLLESKLIQKHKPKYNVRWRDDKSYLYIKATVRDTYPKFFITRREEDANAIYFGPFPSVSSASDILREIRKVFPFCTQKKIGNRRCFYAKIKLCDPCPSDILKMEGKTERLAAQKEYKQNVRNALKVLEGKTDLVLKGLYKKIEKFKKNEQYEEAILYRDRLLRLEGVVTRRKFDSNNLEEYNKSEKRILSLKKLLGKYFEIDVLSRIECYDMSTLMFEDSTASMVVFEDGLSNRQEYKRFKIKDKNAESDFEMLYEVLHRRFKNDWGTPHLIVIDGGRPQVKVAQKVFRELEITIPLIGIAKRPDRLIIGDESLVTVKPPHFHPGFQLIQALRDESHRFAKKYHIHLRNKKML